MQTGTVKFFNQAKGFGFIKEDATGRDIFVHISALGGQIINENDKVTFILVEGKKGLNAEKVQKVS